MNGNTNKNLNQRQLNEKIHDLVCKVLTKINEKYESSKYYIFTSKSITLDI